MTNAWQNTNNSWISIRSLAFTLRAGFYDENQKKKEQLGPTRTGARKVSRMPLTHRLSTFILISGAIRPPVGLWSVIDFELFY
jgi:hypothetical protein